MSAQRLMVFDRTCTRSRVGPGLSHAWAAGAHLYRWMGRLDAWHGAASWPDAFEWLDAAGPPAPIAHLEIWAHGRWGEARMDGDVLDAAALTPGHRLHAGLARLRDRLAGPEALVWFRTCETFGTQAGQRFARGLADFLGCRVAGHTHIIGVLQSGLRELRPGETPNWPADEGVRPSSGPSSGPSWEPSSGQAPVALASSWRAPSTVTFLHGRPPDRTRPKDSNGA